MPIREVGVARAPLLRYAEILATVCEAPALIDATHEVLASLERAPDSAS